MHFADLSIKMRQIGLTLSGTIIALAIVLHRTNLTYSFDIPILCLSIPVAALLCFVAAFVLYAAKILDHGMYHQMLRGAVRFNELYERQLDDMIGWQAGLTETISAYSRYEQPDQLDRRNEKGEVWKRPRKSLLAGNKINRFYLISVCALCSVAVLLIFIENA